METEKSIEALNTLIQINNDRIEGYETASKETDEHDLKTMFAELAQTSHTCHRELVSEVNRLGGTPTEGTKITGKFFRVWMDVKAALTGKNRKAILNSCEFGEDKAVETYSDVLKDDSEHLSAELQTIIRAQHVLIKADHDKVKSLRDAAGETQSTN